MGEQAELLAPRQHLGAEACRHPEQTDGDGHGLQPVGDGKAAVEDAQRALADGTGRDEFQPCCACLRGGLCASIGPGQRADRLLQLRQVGAIAGPQCQIAGTCVARQAQVVARSMATVPDWQA